MVIHLENGDSREENVRAAFRKVINSIDISDKKVFVKPNFTSFDIQLANTNPGTLAVILEEIRKHSPTNLTVAEGSGESWQKGKTTESALEKFGVLKIINEYKADFIDLNEEADYFLMDVDTIRGKDKVRINNVYKNFDVLVSLTCPKSHDYAIMTGSTKNFAMAMVKPEDRVKLHGLVHHASDEHEYEKSIKLIHLNLAALIKKVFPTISVIDGFEGMEGNGPLFGTSISCGWALASDEPISCDCTLAELMGIDPKDVGYLNYLTKGTIPVNDSDMVEKIMKLKKQFALHEKIDIQRRWK
jgi:uncharacterized protein (DUF362 family)